MNPVATATVVITTKNRKDEVRTCLHSVRRQVPTPEVIVIDDASADGTAAMIREEFPEAILIARDRTEGMVRNRNEAARLATGSVIVSLDDDAAFTATDTVRVALDGFSDDRVAAVAIPYIDVNRDAVIRQAAPDADGQYVVASFIGTAYAMRKDLFNRLGGFHERLFRQGEERDLCIRMLATGHVVQLGTGAPIHHFESPKRSFRLMDHYGPRNAILFAWQNVPFPAVMVILPVTTLRVLAWTANPSRFLTRLLGVLSGFRECLREPRRPVRPEVFALWRRLSTDAPLPLAEVIRALERAGL